MEPEKCDGWVWMTWEELADVGKRESLFLPLLNLLKEYDVQALQ